MKKIDIVRKIKEKSRERDTERKREIYFSSTHTFHYRLLNGKIRVTWPHTN